MTELPPPNTRRWVARRKAAVVAAVSSGVITVEEACRRYQMSEEELFAWQRAFENYGIVGLRAGYFRQYRSARPPRPADPSLGQVAPARSDNAGAAVWQPGYRYNRAAPEDDAFEVGAINGASTNIPVGGKLRRSLERAALPSVIRGPLCDFRLPLDVVITSSVSSLGAEFLLLLDDGTL